MAGSTARMNGIWIVAAIFAAVVGGLLYWQLKPWASDADKARLAAVRDRIASFYQANPPIPEWRILGIEVAKPGIVVALDIPARSAELIQRRAAVYRLQAAGAICPERDSPIYDALGRFRLEIHPQADGKPVLVEADCANLRGVRKEPDV